MPKFARPNSYTGKQSNQSWTGQTRAANDIEAAAGVDEQLYISPATLASAVDNLLPDATTTSKGKVELATLAELQAGNAPAGAWVPTSNDVATVIAGIIVGAVPPATTAQQGIVELATDLQVVTPYTTDVPNTAVQPSNITAMFAAPPAIGGTTPAAGAFTSVTATAVGAANALTSDTASSFGVTGAGVDVTVSSNAGRVVINGEEAAADAVRILSAAGGLDVDVAALLSLTSSRDNAQAIFIEASAGGIDITAAGAAAEDIDITNTAGSIRLVAGENAADSIVISSTIGGIDIIAAGAAAGEDIDITATGSSVNITSTENNAGAIIVRANGGTSERVTLLASQGTGADSINLESTAGGITLSAALSTGDAINISAGGAAGGIDIDAGTGGIVADTTGAAVVTSTADSAASIFLHANGGTSETIRLHSDLGTSALSLDLLSDVGGISLRAGLGTADAINITATAAGGGIDVDAGTAGFLVDTTGAISLDSAANSNLTVTGAFSMTVNSTAGQLALTSGQAAANAVRIQASDAGGGIDVDAGTAGIAVDTTGAFSIDGAAASNVTVTGAGIDLTLASVLGSVLIDSTEDAALAIRLHANGGTSETIQIHSDQGTGVGSIGLLSDVGGITVRSTGLASADAINLEAAAGGIDVDAALQINIASSQNAVDAIRIVSSAGGIDIDAVGAATEDINITNTGGSVVLVATEAAADAIVLNSSNAAGGIDILTGGGSIDLSSAGSVTMVAGTDTQAGATCTVNKNVFAATYTGFTTAAAASQVFTLTNSVITATSQVILTLCNEGANDAQMTVQRVNRGTGSMTITAKNNGAAALNGNVTITGWIIG